MNRFLSNAADGGRVNAVKGNCEDVRALKGEETETLAVMG
jgi:hypothetical protein